MPTYPELRAEQWFNDEYEPPALSRFNARLRAHYGHSRAQTGSKGDDNHLKGRHRSISWALNSIYCTDRAYGTVDQRDRRGPWNALRATDVGITGAVLRAASARLMAEKKAGRLLGLAEWFGTIDGTHVTGWYEGHVSSSGSSHLSHLHLGYWTEHTDDEELMDLLYTIITGDDTPTGDDDVQLDEVLYEIKNPDGTKTPRTVRDSLRLTELRVDYLANRANLAAGIAEIKAIVAAAADPTDPTVIDTQTQARLTQIVTAIEAIPAEVRDAVADLGEGGAAQVRADVA